MDVRFMHLLKCPISGEALVDRGNELITTSGNHRFRKTNTGIPLFAEEFCSEDGRVQQKHYDKVAEQYLKNLSYPHTEEYMGYLDKEFMQLAKDADLRTVAEICCGRGEAFQLLTGRIGCGIGIDVSVSMLEAARRNHPEGYFFFTQGDATQLPLESEQFDSVFILGGIHHVNDREGLFQEVYRILRPGGKFYWREPVSDFFLWRWLRAIIYKVSPALDADTERPLLYSETIPPLEKAGFLLKTWKTMGFFGYCFLMNSDVLVFNRMFQYIPGIRSITRFLIHVDNWTTKLPGLQGAGLIVVGVAEKPKGLPPVS